MSISSIVATLLQICLRLIPNYKQIQVLKAVQEKVNNDEKIDAWIDVTDGNPN